jgi:PIN domain nuclease of toxin-antitoxin system
MASRLPSYAQLPPRRRDRFAREGFAPGSSSSRLILTLRCPRTSSGILRADDVRILIDTHVFFWHLTDDPLLPEPIEEAILNPNNEVYLSVVAIWEAVVKHYNGKLPLPDRPEIFLPAKRAEAGILPLPLDEGAMSYLAGLPLLHRDPFDRVMVAQALQHELTIATVDPLVKAYDVPTLD